MGRAIILSGGHAGKYNIELVKDLASITAELAAIDSRLTELTAATDAALARKNAAGVDLDEKTAAMNASVAEFISDASKIEEVRTAQSACLAAQAVYRDANTAHSLLLQEKEAKTQRKKILQAASVTENRLGVWCADLTEDLPAGREVSTVEVNGEYRIAPIIYPGGENDNLASSKLQPVQASTPSGVFMNQALFSYWQRWKPTYRIGTITAISGDFCDLTLDDKKSSHQKLAVNPTPRTFSGVPVEYMNGLNGAVFVSGDRVVVEFAGQSWNSPKVIGFESNPRNLSVADGSYYVFYLESGALKIALCTIGQAVTVVETKSYGDISMSNTASKVPFHLKRFTHKVPSGSTVVERSLYFLATSLKIDTNPFPGWTAFAAANPTFPLVANQSDSQIRYTSALMTDMEYVNYKINHDYPHTQEIGGNDVWQLPTSGGMDCEDAALGKAQALIDRGYPASALHIEAGLLETSGTAHAWLVVQTTEGNYALDINSDDVVLNSVLKVNDENLIARRRQIGTNWAFVSAFGWLLGAQNEESPEPPATKKQTMHGYILDPLLNIFYPIGDEFSYSANHQFFREVSVNFSEDNSKIYLAAGKWTDGYIKTYAMGENTLALLLDVAASINQYSLIDRTGTFRTSGASGLAEVVSQSGYYQIIDHEQYAPEENKSQAYWPNLGFAKIADKAFMVLTEYEYRLISGSLVLYNTTYTLTTPEGNALVHDTLHGSGVWTISTDCYFLCFVDDDGLLINGYFAKNFLEFPAGTRYYLYKNGVSILPDICAALGTTEDKICGLAMIPAATRL